MQRVRVRSEHWRATDVRAVGTPHEMGQPDQLRTEERRVTVATDDDHLPVTHWSYHGLVSIPAGEPTRLQFDAVERVERAEASDAVTVQNWSARSAERDVRNGGRL